MNLKGKVHYVGVNDRTTTRFESLWSLKKGVSYNAYIINDEKVALVDTVEVSFFGEFIDKIKAVIGQRPIDYLVINHMEPDHSGSIALIKQYYPNIQLVGNKKTFEMVQGFYGVGCEDGVLVDDTSELVLGEHKLNFALVPMVHWPETMISYDAAARLAFTGDAFGCFGAVNGGPLDVDVDWRSFLPEMTRYYACILGKYGSTVQRALKKVAALGIDFEMLCTTHGPVWTKHVPDVWNYYDRLSSAQWEKGLVVVYGSMYDNSRQVAEALIAGASAAGVKKIRVHNIVSADPSEVLADVYTYNGLALGGPTYNGGLYPPLDDFIQKMLGREVKNHIVSFFGGFTWAGKAASLLSSYTEQLGVDLVGEYIEWKQGAKEETLKQAYELGKALGERVMSDERACVEA